MSVPSFHAKPERRLRNDLLYWMMAWSFALLLVLSFPRKVFRFVPHAPRTKSVCAWVALSPEDEQKALETARTAWQMESAGMRGLRAELISSELPEAEPVAVVPLASNPFRHTHTLPELAPARVSASERALPPETLAPAAEDAPAKRVFPKADLLKLEERILP